MSVRLLTVMLVLALGGASLATQQLHENALRASRILAESPDLPLCGFADVGPRLYARLLSALGVVGAVLAVALVLHRPDAYRACFLASAIALLVPGLAWGWPPAHFSPSGGYLVCSGALVALFVRSRRPSRRTQRT